MGRLLSSNGGTFSSAFKHVRVRKCKGIRGKNGTEPCAGHVCTGLSDFNKGNGQRG